VNFSKIIFVCYVFYIWDDLTLMGGSEGGGGVTFQEKFDRYAPLEKNVSKLATVTKDYLSLVIRSIWE
jgi:hypothetical protein